MLDLGQYDFHLPQELIAQYPTKERTDSRLLVVESTSACREIKFSAIATVLKPGDLLVCNDSKVIRAKLNGRKPTGGRVEILVERIIDSDHLLAQARARRPLRERDKITIGKSALLTVCGREQNFFLFKIEEGGNAKSLLDKHGKVPLPPYIERQAEDVDSDRYQNVYARHDGSVAAPTAGLHFSEQLLDDLKDAGIGIEYVTLHVGAGTFSPIRGGNVEHHRIHFERCSISAPVCERINEAKRQGRRVVAVGTTSVRTLETAALGGSLVSFSGETDLFIKPGFQFRVVDELITNFHLPDHPAHAGLRFCGTTRVMRAYRRAVEEGFRFYSYGDAMLVERTQQ